MTPRVATFCRVVIRAKKPANKAAPAAAEWAEQKTGTKGKAEQSHTQRLPSDPASGRAGRKAGCPQRGIAMTWAFHTVITIL